MGWRMAELHESRIVSHTPRATKRAPAISVLLVAGPVHEGRKGI
jgi:hypothetical protein